MGQNSSETKDLQISALSILQLTITGININFLQQTLTLTSDYQEIIFGLLIIMISKFLLLQMTAGMKVIIQLQ